MPDTELTQRAAAAAESGDLPAAIAAQEEAIRLQRDLLAAQSDPAEHSARLSTMLEELGGYLHAAERFADALAAQEEAIRLLRATLGPEAPADSLAQLSTLLYNQGNYLQETGRFAEAVTAFEQVVVLDERTRHADLESDRARLKDARELAHLTPEQMQVLLAGDKRQTGRLAVAALQRATDAAKKGDFAAAVAAQEQALPLYRAIVAAEDEHHDWLKRLSIILYNLGAYLERVGRRDDAIAAFAEVVAIDERIEHPDLPRDRERLAEARAMAQLSPAEREACAIEKQRAQALQNADKVRDIAIAALRGEFPRDAYVVQTEAFADRAAVGEAPGSPWAELASFLRAAAALVRGDTVIPPVPPAYAGHLAAIKEALQPSP